MNRPIMTLALCIAYVISYSQQVITEIEGSLNLRHQVDYTSIYIGLGTGNMISLDPNVNDPRQWNIFCGHLSGTQNTTGRSNNFFGSYAGYATTTGGANSFFGRNAGSNNSSGSSNSYFGNFAGAVSTGSNNSFYGHRTGMHVTDKSRNIIIGSGAGPVADEDAANDRLYIDVKESNDPLIYGEFDNDILRINGELHLGPNFFSGGVDSDEGIIRSPQSSASDIFIIANDGMQMRIGEVASNSSSFTIVNGGDDDLLLRINESGDLSIKGAYNMLSDKHAKEDFQALDTDEILSKIAELPITKWNYKNSSDTHIGPMAQDFYAAFGLGQGETTIATVDADGVALAAIQALANENVELKEKNEELENQLEKMNQRLSQIEMYIKK